MKEKESMRGKIVNDKRKISEGYTLFKSQIEARRKEIRIFFDVSHFGYVGANESGQYTLPETVPTTG